MVNKIYSVFQCLNKLKDFPPLFFRLILAYGFFQPAMSKIEHFSAIVDWFTSMNFFLPFVSAVLATTTEALGVVLLFLGLGTRIISVPLMFVMLVAIGTVHWENGFAAGGNGFEVPFYYFFMLFSLVITGGGKLSLDYLIASKCIPCDECGVCGACTTTTSNKCCDHSEKKTGGNDSKEKVDGSDGNNGEDGAKKGSTEGKE